MRTRLATLACCALAATALYSASARAQQIPAGDEEARALFQAGTLAYERGEFERALDSYERSYELSPRPAMLYNLATANDRLGRIDAALRHFRSYLDAISDAENAAFVRSRIAILEAQVSSERAASAPLGPAFDPVPAVVALSVGGALVLASLGTLVWWVERNEAIDQCNLVGCVNGAALTSERDAAMGTTLAIAILGLAGLGVGVALLVTATPRSAPVAVACGPTGAGARCVGRF